MITPLSHTVYMDIVIDPTPIGWTAIDRNTYDCDCDQDGFFCIDVVGEGKTPLDALVDLLEQKDEQASSESTRRRWSV